MAKISIDGIEYESDTMSQESRQQLDMLVMTEQKVRQLQAEIAMLQTARQAYATALKASLLKVSSPAVGLGETIE
ncbi:MAG: hypothetical protein ACK5DW_06715 [Burkholderiales bacterium]|jgi:hypothetical protein|nr:hypothetical protein [Betaproteobacteria bacterium]NBT99277.1 hypothetical protein [Betaproteobacteria bacterium]NCW86515.1 hypothetical protein [Oxalobacteraceae bacterium]NDG07957.1 hypothetical protein [Oxalobacteraceae bacterium]